jgi:hypothetical protein
MQSNIPRLDRLSSAWKIGQYALIIPMDTPSGTEDRELYSQMKEVLWKVRKDPNRLAEDRMRRHED